MENKFEHLLSPLKIGKMVLKNRMIVAPTGGWYNAHVGPHGEFTDQKIEYIVERARGGFSMFYSSPVRPDYLVENNNEDALFMRYKGDFKRQALRLNERAGFYDMKIIQQLSMGLGRNYVGPYSCSENPVFFAPDKTTPVLTVDEIHKKIDCIVEAAALMKASGFAGVEAHALHWGYLLDNFAMAITNHREDEYGGCLENRLRVCKEIVEGIKQECGADFPVGMRLGMKSYMKGFNKPDFTGEHEAGRTLEEGVRIAQLLESYGYDMLSVDAGTYDSFYYAASPIYMPEAYCLPLAKKVKEAVSIPVLCGSRMADPYTSDKAIAEGKIDAIVLGRPTIADPYFAKKIEMGREDKIRPCINCLVGCLGKLYAGEHVSCAVNPGVRKELIYGIDKAPIPKKIAVIGGGVAGMEVARVSKIRGHEVTLYEKTDRLGGLQIPAGAHDFKKQNHMLIEWYKRELEDLQVPVVYGAEMDAEKIKALAPDVAVFSVGSRPVMPPIPGIDHPKCSTGVDVLDHKVDVGQKVVVVGGGLVGCEIAIDLAMHGKTVSIVEAAPDVLVASEMIPIMVKQMIPDLIEYWGVTVHAGNFITAINDKGAVITPAAGGESVQLEADNVVMSIGMRPVHAPKEELYGTGIEVYEVGDCRRAGNVFTAVNSAYDLARKL